MSKLINSNPILINLFNALLVVVLLKSNNKYKINVTLLISVLKGYVLFMIILINLSASILATALFSNIDLTILIFVKLRLHPLSLFMVIIVVLISSIVLLNSMNYLSIIDSYIFLFYIILFQLSMVSFILSQDLVITFFYWDLLGLVSYLPINFWSIKINHGIKAVMYNKIGDNFSLLLLVVFYSFLSFVSYCPELSIRLVLPFVFMIVTSSFIFSRFHTLIIELFTVAMFCILYSKSAQIPFCT